MPEIITPSKPNVWKGVPDKNGFTVEQNEAIARLKLRGDWRDVTRWGLPDVYLHRRRIEPERYEQPVYTRYILCPVLGSSHDKRQLRVIAPNGMQEWLPWKK
jgi:hypothetical protein